MFLYFTLNLRLLILRQKLKTNHRMRFFSRKLKLPVYITEKGILNL